MEIIILNFVYSFFGVLLGIVSMYVGYKVLNRLTRFSTSEELGKGNVAVGLKVLGMFIGIGICAGLVIGMALN